MNMISYLSPFNDSTCASVVIAVKRCFDVTRVNTGRPYSGGTDDSISVCIFTKFTVRIGSSRLSSTHLPGRGSGTSDGGIASQFDVESFWPLKFPVIERRREFSSQI